MTVPFTPSFADAPWSIIASLRAEGRRQRQEAAGETDPGMRALTLRLAADAERSADSFQAQFDVGGWDDILREAGQPTRRPGDRILDYGREAERHRRAVAQLQTEADADGDVLAFHRHLAASCAAIAASRRADPHQPPPQLDLPADFRHGPRPLLERHTLTWRLFSRFHDLATAATDRDAYEGHLRDAALINQLGAELRKVIPPRQWGEATPD